MTKRKLKQIIYGAFYLLIIFGIIFGLYFLSIRPGPSCFDGKQNQDEEGIDCGGSSCESCAIRSLIPIEINPTILPVDKSKSNLLLEFLNLNATFGATDLQYQLNVYGVNDEVLLSELREIFVYPSESTYRVLANLPIDPDKITRVEGLPINTDWESLEEFNAPRTQAREIDTSIDFTRKRVEITGLVKNDNPFALIRARVFGILFDRNGSIVGASQTVLQDLEAREERAFQVILPLISGVNDEDGLQERIIIQAERE